MESHIPAPVARGHNGEMLSTRTHRMRSNASMARKQPQAQLLNFPISPELREMIYSYFMALKYDISRAAWSEGPSLQFHTQIFKINKTIREEATAYLHRTHQFVGLRYFLPNFEDMLLAYHVPVVTHPGRWSAYVNRVLGIDARGHQLEDGAVFAERGVTWASGRTVMLVRDLPALCEMLRAVAFYTSAKYVYIDTPRDYRVVPDSHQGTGFRLKLNFKINSSSTAQFSTEAQLSLLQSIRTIKGAVLATFDGFPIFDEKEEASIAAAIRPSLVWAQAREWEILDMMLRYKRRADELVLTQSDNKAHDALRIYTRITGDHRRVETLPPASGLVDPALRRVQEIRRSMGLDFTLYAAQMLIRDGSLAEAFPLLLSMHGGPLLVDRPGVPAQTKVMFSRLKFDIALYMHIEGWTGTDHLREAMRTMRATCAKYSWDARLQSDYVLAEELLRLSMSGADRDRALKDTLRLRVSVLAFPVQVIDSQPAEDQLGRPDGLSGWEDVLHKAELSKEEKESINKVQREHQLRETVF